MFRVFSLSLIIVTFLLNCNRVETQGNDIVDSDEFDNLTDHFTDYLKQIGKEELQDGSYLIIPADICPACIEKIKDYFNEGFEHGFTQYILVGRSSKEIRHTFSDKVVNNRRVWLDQKGKWYDHVLKDQEVAEIIYVLDNRVTKKVSLFVSNLASGLHELSCWEAARIQSISFGKLPSDTSFIKFVNAKSPTFKGVTTHGNKFSLRQGKNRIVVLNFWSHRCPYCIEEMPILNMIYKEFKDKGVEVVSIYKDSEESLEKYFNDDRFNSSDSKFIEFPVIANATDICDKFGVTGFPMTFVIDPKGEIAHISFYTERGLGNANETYPHYYKILKGSIIQIQDEQRM